MRKRKFNNREIDVLTILWDSDTALTVNDISAISGISKSTVSPVLKKLLTKNYIKVEDIVLSGKTLTRKYIPIVDREKFILEAYKDIEIENLLNHFLEEEGDPSILPKIEQLIKKKKKKFKEVDREWALPHHL